MINILLVYDMINTIKSVVPGDIDEIRVVREIDGLYSGILYFWIFPITISFVEGMDVLAISLYVLIFYLYVNHVTIYFNPILREIFGYRVYEIEYSSKRGLLLSKDKLYEKYYNFSGWKIGKDTFMVDELQGTNILHSECKCEICKVF